VIESDHNEFNEDEKGQIKEALAELSAEGGEAAKAEDAELGEDEQPELPKRGPMPAEPGKWAACVRVLDPKDGQTQYLLELGNNEHAVSLATVVFHDRGGEVFVLVGTVKDMTLHPRAHAGGFVHVYRLIEGELRLLHTTEVEDVPGAICAFGGRVLISVGKTLRIYDLGKRKLLRKCENKNFPTFITDIRTAGDRIYVTDLQESFHFIKYKRQENQIVVFADDSLPRMVTSQVLLDFDTIAGGMFLSFRVQNLCCQIANPCFPAISAGDKFGNVFITRLPSEVSDEAENPTGNRILWDTGILNGAANKLDQIMHFHVGSVVTGMVRTQLVPGGADALLYSTVTGGLGAMLPFSSREDVDFFSNLEMHMRQENAPLSGRDHLGYRSSFMPVKVAPQK
jgi:splicing factor 3B subunit 3